MKHKYLPRGVERNTDISIKKTKKDDSNIEYYRLKALLSDTSKIADKLVLCKIVEHIDKNNFLPENNFSFRKNKGVTDYSVELIKDVEKSKTVIKQCILITTDILKA